VRSKNGPLVCLTAVAGNEALRGSGVEKLEWAHSLERAVQSASTVKEAQPKVPQPQGFDQKVNQDSWKGPGQQTPGPSLILFAPGWASLSPFSGSRQGFSTHDPG
jgi:hypothetical protein